MDASVQQSSNADTTPKVFQTGPLAKILPLILVLVVGLVLGFFAQKISRPSENFIPESKLPFSTDLLSHPLVYQWQGSTRGTLVEKTAQSITLQDDQGNRLTIPFGFNDNRVVTAFFDVRDPSKPSGRLSVDDIPIGSYLRGEFWVIPGEKNKISGSAFEWSNKNPE